MDKRRKRNALILVLCIALIGCWQPSAAFAGVKGKGASRAAAEAAGPGAAAVTETTAAAEETTATQETVAVTETAAAAEETAAAQETAAETTTAAETAAAETAAAETAGTQETAAAETAAVETAAASGQSGTLTMIAAGDNLIHKTIVDKAWRPETGTHDFSFLYSSIGDLIRSRDLAVINQETIFISDNALISDYPTFGTPQAMGEALVDAGFDIVLSATNHTWDKGFRGVSDTLNYWKTAHPEIKLLGIHESPEAFNTIDYVEKNGIRLALFNYTYGLNGFSASQYYLVNLLGQKDKFLSDVRTAEANADMTVCFLHIGEEYQYQPTAYQKGYINDLIEAGADLIICAHPHVVEPCGVVTTASGKSALVYYSCGNLVSAQSKLPRLLGGLADVTITKDESGTRITAWDFIPTVTHFSGRDVRAILLKDYTDELASIHHVNMTDQPVTTGKLWSLWHQITGR